MIQIIQSAYPFLRHQGLPEKQKLQTYGKSTGDGLIAVVHTTDEEVVVPSGSCP